jgi:hypothetical protein
LPARSPGFESWRGRATNTAADAFGKPLLHPFALRDALVNASRQPPDGWPNRRDPARDCAAIAQATDLIQRQTNSAKTIKATRRSTLPGNGDGLNRSLKAISAILIKSQRRRRHAAASRDFSMVRTSPTILSLRHFGLDFKCT